MFLDVGIVDDFDVLEERLILKSPGNQLFDVSLIGDERFTMCVSRGGSSGSLLL